MILPPVSTVIKQTLEAQGVTDLEELRRQHAQHARDAPAKSRAEAVQGKERPEGKGKRSSSKSANVPRDKSKRQKTRSSSASGKSVHSAGGAIGQAGAYFVAPGGFYPIGGHATIGGSGSPASDKHAPRAGGGYPGHKLAHGVMGVAIATPSTGSASGNGLTLGPSGAGTSSRGTSGGGGPSGSGSSGSSGLGSPLLPGGYNANGTAMLSAANLQAAAAHAGMLVPLAPAHHIPGATVGMPASSYHRPVGGPQLPGGMPAARLSSGRRACTALESALALTAVCVRAQAFPSLRRPTPRRIASTAGRGPATPRPRASRARRATPRTPTRARVRRTAPRRSRTVTWPRAAASSGGRPGKSTTRRLSGGGGTG